MRPKSLLLRKIATIRMMPCVMGDPVDVNV